MFEQFSRGYYLGRLYVRPRDGAEAQMCREQHEHVQEQLYEDVNNPLVMKLGSRHLAVTGDEGVPANSLAVPTEILEDLEVTNPPSLREVLLAKADRAAQLLRLTDGRVDSSASPLDVDSSPFDPEGSTGI